MIILCVIFIAMIISLTFCYWYQTRSRVAKLLNQFPSIAPITPIIGNVELLNNNQEILFAQLRKFSAKHSETYAGWGGFVPTLHIITADDAEIILSNINKTHIKKGLIYYSLRPWMGTGLLTSTGDKWHNRRKLLTLAFHNNVLKSYVDVFGEQSNKLIDKLKAQGKGATINILPQIEETVLTTLCETILGVKFNSINGKVAEYFRTIEKYIEIVLKMAVSPLHHPKLNLFHLSPLFYQQKKLVQKLLSFTKKIINERQENFEDMKLYGGPSKFNSSFLDFLIDTKRQMGAIDDIGIQEEVDTFMFEGHGTTTSATLFTLMLVAKHEDVQKIIIEELDEIFAGSTRRATYEDLQNMGYLDRCLKECLRLYPSIPLIVRRLKKDTQLTHHMAPAGAEVFIHIYDIHRDTRYYPNPEKFDPDRFLSENSARRHPFAYIPFSVGPRTCIGYKFALLEMKSIVSSILRNFTIEHTDISNDFSSLYAFVLKPKGPVYIRFNPRFK